jgi:hypothetical protein
MGDERESLKNKSHGKRNQESLLPSRLDEKHDIGKRCWTEPEDERK